MKRLILSTVVLVSVAATRPASAGPGVTGGTLPSSSEFIFGFFYEGGSSGKVFHFQPEVNFLNKGVAKYISVPLFFKFKFDAGPVQPFFQAGPDVSFKIEGASTKTFDFAADAAGGLEFGVTPGIGLVLEARYSHGFTNVSDLVGADIKTKGIQLWAGLHLDW